MDIPSFEEIIEPNDQTEARREGLEKLRTLVGIVYPNKFARSAITGSEDTITALKAFGPVVDVEQQMAAIKAELKEGERPPAEKKDAFNEQLKAVGTVRIAGRLTTPTRGNFVHLTDGISKLQVYCNKKGPLALVKNDGEGTLDEANGWAAWQLLDHGDFIGVEGYLFVTNTGEVSVHVEKLQFLVKAMLPMPDKMHGIADPEIRQRQRYADLIASSLQVKSEPPASAGGQELTTRETFERRAKLISSIRRYLEDHGYVEVETPMLTPKATGAAAKPFETHHNALDIKLYARIAPELYLKRLVVGGFEKVYELNRNFRNEGISYKHNPEFTMLEFYCAYMDVNGMMDFCEKMLLKSVQKATGGTVVKYKGNLIDFNHFDRLTMKSAIVHYAIEDFQFISGDPINELHLDDPTTLRSIRLMPVLINEAMPNTHLFGDDVLRSREILAKQKSDFILANRDNYWNLASDIALGRHTEAQLNALSVAELREWEHITAEFGGSEEQERTKNILALFESYIEELVIQPTFIIDFPKSISPLSKASPENPQIAERFELFINGMEVANGFSELNDPKEQYNRFVDQMAQREGGDEEAMVLDEDYIRALSYGMPPAAGIGIGIDRLTMLLTNKHSIRDVILFPHMRPEKNRQESEETASDN